MDRYKNIGLGGTFDRFHIGHHLFFDIAAFYGENVHIGLTSSKYLDKIPKKYNEIIQNFEKRRNSIKKYLSKRSTTYHFSAITSPGMDRKLAENSELDALVVSQETCSGAIVINQKRVKNNNQRLVIIIVPFVKRSDGTRESSTKLRKVNHEKGE